MDIINCFQSGMLILKEVGNNEYAPQRAPDADKAENYAQNVIKRNGECGGVEQR